jgi:hypothetical protein
MMRAPMRLRPLLLLLLASATAFACTTFADPPKCVVGADCMSGICNADGTCAPAPTGSSGTGGTSGATTASVSASTGVTTSTGVGTGGSAACVPNQDGTITRAEVPLAAGLHATFSVTGGVTYDTTGMKQADGSRVWDLTVAFNGDHPLVLDTLAIDPTAWYAADFPTASYAARLSEQAADADLLGIFKLTGSALLLLGVASTMDSASATKLIYATPIVVLDFPLTEGKKWDTLSAVTGKVSGITIGGIYNEEYTSTVDAHGTLKTPYADFPVLRVNTKFLRFLNGVSTLKYTHSFVTECFGNVGTIISNDDNTLTLQPEFSTAAELWRFSK